MHVPPKTRFLRGSHDTSITRSLPPPEKTSPFPRIKFLGVVFWVIFLGDLFITIFSTTIGIIFCLVHFFQAPNKQISEHLHEYLGGGFKDFLFSPLFGETTN